MVTVRWRVLVPVKPAVSAKTRLQGATREWADHLDLVRAIQLDTLAAAVATAGSDVVAGVYVVADHPMADAPSGTRWLADGGGGLNAALATAAEELRAAHPGDGVVALVADLPALRPHDLLDVLTSAAAAGRGFVTDAAGTGTTLLAAGGGRALQPLFGAGSAARHAASGALPLPAAAGVRQDVDTAEDLQRCLRLGVGAHTADMVAHLV